MPAGTRPEEERLPLSRATVAKILHGRKSHERNGSTSAMKTPRPPFWRDWLALAVAVLALGGLVAVARALGIE